MRDSGQEPNAETGLEPIGDPDDQTGDFAGEHEQFVADEDAGRDSGERESPSRYGGGLDHDGPP